MLSSEMATTTIILHTPDKNKLTFSPQTSIGLREIPGAILPFLMQEGHLLPNGLLLQHGVNAVEHFFVVVPFVTPELGEGEKYHVLAVPEFSMEVSTFGEFFNETVNTYKDILEQKSYTGVKFSATNCGDRAGEVHFNSALSYPCGTFFLVHSDLTQVHKTVNNVAALQDHESHDEPRSNSVLLDKPVEHSSPDKSKIPSRQNKADALMPDLTSEVQKNLGTFGQLLPEKDVKSIMVPEESCLDVAPVDGTLVTPRKESSQNSVRSQVQEEYGKNLGEGLYQGAGEQPEVGKEKSKAPVQSVVGADNKAQKAVEGVDVKIASSGDNLDIGKGVIKQAEDDQEGSEVTAANHDVSPVINSFNKLRIEEKKKQPAGQAEHNVLPQEMRQVSYLEHACNGFCGDQNCKDEHDRHSFEEGLAQMKDLVQQLRDGHHEAAVTLQPYVLLHCSRCPGSICKVPHLVAGCPPPSDDKSSTTSRIPTFSVDATGTDTSPFSTISDHVTGICQQVSVDSQPAFCSQTSPTQSNKKNSVVSFDSQPAFCSLTPDDQNDKEKPNLLKVGENNETNLAIASHQEAHLHCHPPEIVTDRTQYPQNVAMQQPTPVVAYQEKRRPGVTTKTDLVGAHQQVLAKATFAKVELKDQENGVFERPLQCQADPQVFPRATTGSSGFRHTIEQEGRRVARSLSQFDENSGRQKVPSVMANGFQHISVYSNLRRGTIIFSREDCLTVGLSYSIPNMERSLGKGGNGKVTLHSVNQKIFAVKKTNYRSRELNSWIKLSHRNLMPLLAVMIDPVEKCCYQFMPRMKENFSEAMRSVGTLKDLSCSLTVEEWKQISTNVLYILKSVLKGLQHLQEHNMQHCDVKASNVLLGECPHCSSALQCNCPEQNEFTVFLADFDSMKETEMPVDPATLPLVECKQHGNRVMGTCGYRAPEQFSSPKYHHKIFEKTIMDGHIKSDKDFSCGGPWCDVWSFGVMLAYICFGKPTMDTISDANILSQCPSVPLKVTPANEVVHAYVYLYHVTKASVTNVNLRRFATIVSKCLEPKYRERPKAEDLLKELEAYVL